MTSRISSFCRLTALIVALLLLPAAAEQDPPPSRDPSGAMTRCVTVVVPVPEWDPPKDLGTLQGQVKTPKGGVLAEVRVELHRGASEGVYATTDANGTYGMRGIVPDKYEVRYAKPGFATTIVRSVAIGVGQKVTRNVRMTLPAPSLNASRRGVGSRKAAMPVSHAREPEKPTSSLQNSGQNQTDQQRVIASLCLGIQKFEQEALHKPGLPPNTSLKIWYQQLSGDITSNVAPKKATTRHLWRTLARLRPPFLVDVKWSDLNEYLDYQLRFYVVNERRVTQCDDLRHCLPPAPERMIPDLILGPTTTDGVETLKLKKWLEPSTRATDRRLRVPVITPSATATDLTFLDDRPKGYRYLYRFIAPDVRITRRLADEITSGVPPKRIVILYQGDFAALPKNGWPESSLN